MTTGVETFLSRHGVAAAPRRPLAGDASGRRYVRLESAGTNGGGLLLMETPQPDLDIVQFRAIADLLRSMGLSAPQVLAVSLPLAEGGTSGQNGLALLEDFGDDTFTRLMDQGKPALPLYLLATDLLIALHQRFSAPTEAVTLPRYDAARFQEQAALLADHGLPEALGRPLNAGERDTLERAWAAVIPLALTVPNSLLLRDYHVDNLIHLPARDGVAACGLLDFQDAGLGPVAYDLVSLLEDARRNVDPTVAGLCRARYLTAFPALDPARFATACAVLAALRHTRIIAVFCRLAGLGKPHYLAHLPRVRALLAGALAHPALRPLCAPLAPLLPA